MSEILIYNLGPEKEAKLKLLCRSMCIDARTVEKEDYGFELGYLTGRSENAAKRAGSDFEESMLYISGLKGGMLNLFLSQLRRNRILVPLKAIETETNVGFTSYELYRELCAEREAFSQGMTAHNN